MLLPRYWLGGLRLRDLLFRQNRGEDLNINCRPIGVKTRWQFYRSASFCSFDGRHLEGPWIRYDSLFFTRDPGEGRLAIDMTIAGDGDGHQDREVIRQIDAGSIPAGFNQGRDGITDGGCQHAGGDATT